MTRPTVPPAPLPEARRITWQFLPSGLRMAVERRFNGSPVVHEDPVPWGFTPGMASVLTCKDGTKHFVKAASTKAQRGSAASYHAEIAVLRSLHPSLPVPRLQWAIDDDWVILSTEYAEGRPPHLGVTAELVPCLNALEVIAAGTTPAPYDAPPIAEEFAGWPAYWEQVPGWPHRDEAAALAATFAEHLDGETLVHTDLRADNLLVHKGLAVVVDWTWPVLGAPWLDTVALLALARADGAPADDLLAERALTGSVPADAVDAWLALLAGYHLKSALDPVPASAPHLRRHQQATGEAFWSWLADRRGWSA